MDSKGILDNTSDALVDFYTIRSPCSKIDCLLSSRLFHVYSMFVADVDNVSQLEESARSFFVRFSRISVWSESIPEGFQCVVSPYVYNLLRTEFWNMHCPPLIG